MHVQRLQTRPEAITSKKANIRLCESTRSNLRDLTPSSLASRHLSILELWRWRLTVVGHRRTLGRLHASASVFVYAADPCSSGTEAAIDPACNLCHNHIQPKFSSSPKSQMNDVVLLPCPCLIVCDDYACLIRNPRSRRCLQ